MAYTVTVYKQSVHTVTLYIFFKREMVWLAPLFTAGYIVAVNTRSRSTLQ